MPKNIYEGYNPVYEQMVNNSDNAGDTQLSDITTTILTNLIGLMQSGGLEEIKSLDSFQKISADLKNCKNFNELRTLVNGEIQKMPDSLKNESQKGINDLFDLLMKIPDINSKYTITEKIIEKIMDAMIPIIKKGENEITTNESLILEKGGSGRLGSDEDKEADDTSKELDSHENTDEDIRLSNKWYIETANHLMNIATAFKTETTVPVLDEKIAKNEEVKGLIAKALDLYNQALNLQISEKRKGFIIKGDIITKGGELSGKDFKIKARNLDEEIRRNREELAKIKSSITKINVPVPVTPPLPKDNKISKADDKGVSSTKKENIQTAENNSACGFPIGISLHTCDQVKKLQVKLMEIDCINKTLSSHGGADGKYGKYTSMAANAAYSIISKKEDFKSSVLTEEMYNAIINKDFNEKKSVKENQILSFDVYFELNEQELSTISDSEAICRRFSDKLKTIPGKTGIVNPENKEIPKTNKTNGTSNWNGLKPVNNGIYGIGYDESVKSAIFQAAAGALIGGAVVVTGGALLAGFVPAIGMAAAAEGAGAAAGSAALSAGFRLGASFAVAGIASTVTSAPIIIGAGLAGAAMKSSWNRANILGINIFNGFISRQAMISITRGMIDTLDGWVSHDDLEAIMSTLCLVKGAFTTDKESKRAISAWGELKSMYKDKENDDLADDINNITTRTTKDVKDFPDFNSSNLKEGTTMNADDALGQIKDAINKLNTNETSLTENIKDISSDDIKKFIDNIGISKKEK